MTHSGMASPTMFCDIPTKRPLFFFLIVAKKYFALERCESNLVANRLSPRRQIEVIDGVISEISRIVDDDVDLPTSRLWTVAERQSSSGVTSS